MYIVYKEPHETSDMVSELADDSEWAAFEKTEDAYTWAWKMDTLDERNKRLEPKDE